MVSQIAQNALKNPTQIKVFNNQIPKEAVTVPLGPFNFATQATYNIDLTYSQELARLNYIQTFYIDNADNPFNLIVKSVMTGQQIIAPAFSQGYYPVLAPTGYAFVVTSNGAVNCASAIYCINIAIEPCVWFVVDEFHGGQIGYQQLTGISAAQALTVPVGSRYALINFEAQSIRWRDDGTNPTASVGMLQKAGDFLYYTGNLAGLKFIETTPSGIVNASFYG